MQQQQPSNNDLAMYSTIYEECVFNLLLYMWWQVALSGKLQHRSNFTVIIFITSLFIFSFQYVDLFSLF